MNLGDKLKKIRIDKGYSMEDMKNILNSKYNLQISKSMISRWENGVSEPINKYLSVYAKEFNLDMNDLLGIYLKNIPNVMVNENIKRIPILGEITCGEPILCQENFDGYTLTDPSMIEADFSIYADGDSMIDANIHDGDLVFIKQTSVVENGAICAVLIDDTATLKKFYKIDNQILLQSENNKYQPIIIIEEDIRNVRILGEMVGVYSRRNK